MENAELPRMFTYHKPTAEQESRYTDLRQAGFVLVGRIRRSTRASAEQTLAIRKVQEAIMWANAAIAINEASVTPRSEPLPESPEDAKAELERPTP